MTISRGGAGHHGGINVTPLIDVLLVLLIIFMVITPLAPKGLDAAIPPQSPPEDRHVRPLYQVVVAVRADRTIRVNGELVDIARLPDRLRRIARTGAPGVFVQGDPSLEFRDVAAVVDIATGAGFPRVSLVPPPVR